MQAETVKRLVFHIGMPKCGSTYLQRLVFPNLRGLHYEKYSNRLTEGTIEERARNLEETVATTPGTVLFSAESLCGHPTNMATYDEFGELLRHIPTDYKVTVIVVVRRQDGFIDSLYRHHVRKGGSLEFDQFYSLERAGQRVADKVRNGSVHYSYCDYSRFLDYPKGHEVTLAIIPFELMQNNLTKFVEAVVHAIGVSERYDAPATFVNRGPSMPEFVAQKWLNRVAFQKGFTAAGLRKLAILAVKGSRLFSKYNYVPATVLTNEDRKKIVEFYRASNSRIAKVCEFDLDALGYC
jgi:hypothetical protein